MKTLFSLLVGFLISLSAISQTVTINVRGNNTQQVIVDGRTYSVTNDYNSNTNSNVPITINNLQVGQHTLQIVSNSNSNEDNTTTFRLRSGYDMQITITANGSVQLRETKRTASTNTDQYTPMSDADFSILYRDVNSQWRSSSKVTMINSAFVNRANYFTSAQAKQLIQLVNSQSDRLTLAKASYRTITDPENFNTVNELLTSQASRNDLASYVAIYNSGNSSASMSNANYNTIYRTARRQSTNNEKVNYIANAFTNTNNYFTVAQARQLIQLVSGESNRLYLAKASYRSITDRPNFSQIQSLLNSTASRNELTSFINSYDGEVPVYSGTAMSDADYTALYNRVRNRWGLGAKMSLLTDIFNTETYYFTVAQAKQLIQLVSSESNRLQLAKLSYNNIVDPGNFTQLYDVLANQTSRNELAAYVNSYSSNR